MKKKYPILKQLEIIDIAAEGKSIGKWNEMVVFVLNCIPGDIVDVQLTNKRKTFAEGFPVLFHKYSENRIKAKCQHFGVCGGCKWQHLPYTDQLKFKQKQVVDALERIGKVDFANVELLPILPSENVFYYRNKLEFTFSNKRWLTRDEIETGDAIKNMNALGFHIPKMFDRVLDITECLHQKDPSNKIRNSIREYALQNELTFFDLRNKGGLLRNLIIRTTSKDELMVIVVFGEQNKTEQEKLLHFISTSFPEITSLFYVVNTKMNDTVFDLKHHLFSGKDHIVEQMEELKFKIGPKSFYQTNSEQAFQLYKIAREFAQLTGNEIVYDLYTGTGTIANFVAHQSKKVVGIELVPEAIEDAKENSRFNNIENTEFFAGDTKDLLTKDFFSQHGKPDVIIVDPPRAGMHKDVVESILLAYPQKIVYVSCNPATQSRDIEWMKEKYTLIKVQPVDMFPHTHHVENVSLLIKTDLV